MEASKAAQHNDNIGMQCVQEIFFFGGGGFVAKMLATKRVVGLLDIGF